MINIRYRVPQTVLEESRTFLYARGLEGNEGMALWIGGVPDGDLVSITRLFIPEQIATRTEFGVAVDMTERAHYTLPDNLASGERFWIRIHSHPGKAYHSRRDDENAVLTHQGAISIVVPDFSREPIAFAGCAIYRLEHGQGWLRLSDEDVTATFEVAA